MKLQNIHEVEDFRKVIHQCKDDVFLKSQEGDVFNLKSAMSEYIALGRLLSEQGDSLELFASNHEDEGLLLVLPRKARRGKRSFQINRYPSFRAASKRRSPVFHHHAESAPDKSGALCRYSRIR